MAIDKAVDSAQLNADLTSVANAIRTKGGTSASLAFPADFVTAIGAIPTGGGGITIDEIADGSFSGAISISTATTIRAGAFAQCASISSIASSSVTSIGGYALAGCSGLITVNFPEVTTLFTGSNLAGYQFAYCSNLASAFLPKLSSWSNQFYIFRDCTSLAVCDLGVVSSINNNTFNGASALRTLILRRNGVATLYAANAGNLGGIYSNPASSTVYVPADKISDYKTASNWSTLYAAGLTFSAIEGSAYE